MKHPATTRDVFMNISIKEITARIQDLHNQIEETKKRMPAHSVKPPIMTELLDLEDEYHALCLKLKQLQGEGHQKE